MSVPEIEYRALKEKVEVLNGDRGDAQKSMAALRRRDLGALQEAAAGASQALSKVGADQQESSQNIADLRQRITAAEGKLDTLSQVADDLGVKVRAIDSEQDAISQSLASISTRLQAVEDAEVQQDQDIAAIQADLDQAEAALAGIVTRVGAVTVPVLKAKTVTAAPTADQYNDLLSDVTAVRKAILDIKAAIAP